ANFGSYYDVCFLDSTTGHIAGSRVLHTVDAGITWQQTQTGLHNTTYLAVSFIDFNTGWVAGLFNLWVGDGTLEKTIDGGTSYELLPSGINETFNDVVFIDYSNGIAVGENGTILISSYGGESWQLEDCGFTVTLHAIHMFVAGSAIVVGDNATILMRD
nr:hypothetical protein [Bacteroidota bacterium]